MVNITRAVSRIFNHIHRALFHADPGKGTEAFFKNVSYTGMGAVGSTIFLFAVNAVAVRVLGPAEYGKYILLLSVSNFMIIPMVMGLEVSLMKYLPEKRHDARGRAVTSVTAFWVMMLAIFVTSVFIYMFKDYLAAWFAVPLSLFAWAFAYSISAALKAFGDGVLKGLHQFNRQAIIAPLYSIIIFIVFFYLFFTAEKTFLLYVWAIMVGFLFCFAAVVFWNKLSLRLSLFDAKTAGTLMRYGLYSLLNAPSWFIITNADRLLMNRFFDVGTVGLYAVYMSTSMIIMGRGLSFFINVFFPTVAGVSSIAAVNQKINKILVIFAVPVIALNALIMHGMFLIYGRAYPFDFSFAILFSVSGLLYFLVHVKWSMIMTRSEAALRHYAWISFGGALLSFVLSYFLIQRAGVLGAVLAASVTYIYFLAFAARYMRARF